MKLNPFLACGRKWIVGTLAMWLVCVAWAASTFAIKDIRVEGLQSVDPGTVFASLPFRTGDTYTEDQGTAAIRALFGLGLFQDVQVQVEGDVVVVIVRERPRVQEISFEGLKEFDKETVLRLLKDIGVAPDKTFDKAFVERAEQEIKRQYLNRSLYAVQVVSTVTPVANNRVNLQFQVVEGGVAKIREMRIVGAKAYTEANLLDQLDQNTGSWLSWYTKSDRYSQAKLNGDLETLRAFYLSRGFLEFRIDSTQVAITPDKDAVALTINITEGQRYAVSDIRLEGDYLGRDAAFAARVSVKPGQTYNADDVAKTVQDFREYFGEFGYAFARIQADPVINREQAQVAMVFKAQPLQRVYVRRIEIAGNNSTRDEVVRREFRQMESAWYDGQRIKQSRNRVDRLGFFKTVNIEHREVPGSPDQVDLVMTVEEKPTGSLSFGAGYSQSEKLSLIAGIQQENVLGSGNSLSFNVDTSSFNRTIALSATDPYFTPDGISRSFDLYYRTTRPYTSQVGDYKLVTAGGAVRLGVPFTENDTVYFGLGLESTDIKSGSQLPQAYQEFADTFGSPATSLPLTVGWARDRRDSLLAPSEGRYQRVAGVLGLAGDTRYMTATYQFQQYWPLSKKYTLAFNTEASIGQGLSGRPLPVFKYFTGGGLGSVRGFQQGTLGGTSCILDAAGACTGSESHVGGERSFVANAEFLAPLPGAGNDRTLRVFGFVDVGNVYCSQTSAINCGSNALRASSGLGLSWISPVGPLRLAWAKPLRKQDSDKLQTFQFQIGTSF
jgi:outer membrane protein insertion porin family